MPERSKVKTPDWILEGYSSREAYEKSKGIKTKKKEGKLFKVRKCPKCKSEDVGVLLGKEEGKGIGEWECNKCKWIGADVIENELTEDEFIKYLDDKGEK